MAVKKKRRISIRIDMTPMVDIAFLLLIFYMATTTFKPPEARAVELPQSHSQIKLPDKDVINLTVSKDDSMFVDFVKEVEIEVDGQKMMTKGRVVTRVDLSNLASTLLKARAEQIRALVVVKADKRANFGLVQDIMTQMQENYLNRFLIITDNEVDKTTPQGGV